MRKELVCFVDPFVIDWRVIDSDEPWETTVTSESMNEVFALCEERKATVFHIVGSQTYAEAWAELLNKYQLVNYNENKNKIEIEVN